LAKNEYGKLEILGVGKAKSLGVARGVVNNITQTIQSIQQAVLEAENDSGYKINDVVVGIAGQHIRSIQHTDYVIRNNPEEVISEKDIQLLIDQVNKLRCCQVKKLFMFSTRIQNRWSTRNKRTNRNVRRKIRSKFSRCCRSSFINKKCGKMYSKFRNRVVWTYLEPLLLPMRF
jgi:hypothetical protein